MAEDRGQNEGAGSLPAPLTFLSSSLFPSDPKVAEKVFDSFPIENQLALLLKARGKDRLHYLFFSKNPEQLVRQLPDLEVSLTIKEVGERDALPLISLTLPEQFQYLLDLDFWKRDELNPKRSSKGFSNLKPLKRQG